MKAGYIRICWDAATFLRAQYDTARVTACILKHLWLPSHPSMRLPFDHRGVIRSHDLKCTSGSFSLAAARLQRFAYGTVRWQPHASAIRPCKCMQMCRSLRCGTARITAAALCGTWTFADHEAPTSSSESGFESLISSAPATGRGKNYKKFSWHRI